MKVALGIAAALMASALAGHASAALVTFTGLTTADYGTVPTNYQPAELAGTGITTTWGPASKYGSANYNGYDHTVGSATPSQSKYIGVDGETQLYVSFNVPVLVP